MSTDTTYQNNVYLAKLAEQAERYEGIINKLMKIQLIIEINIII